MPCIEKIRKWLSHLIWNHGYDHLPTRGVRVQLRPNINGSYEYTGVDSQGRLMQLRRPSPDENLMMVRFDTDHLHVFKFSDLDENFYLTSQLVPINIVHGQEAIDIKEGHDMWFVRRDRKLKRNEVLLQSYESNLRNYKEVGLFFIITFSGKEAEFKLGNYTAAMEYGVFRIDT